MAPRSDADLIRDIAQSRPAQPTEGLVPALVDDGRMLMQSPVIIESLEQRYPSTPLLPEAAGVRTHVRARAAIIGCDVQPVNNRRILEACGTTSALTTPR